MSPVSELCRVDRRIMKLRAEGKTPEEIGEDRHVNLSTREVYRRLAAMRRRYEILAAGGIQ